MTFPQQPQYQQQPMGGMPQGQPQQYQQPQQQQYQQPQQPMGGTPQGQPQTAQDTVDAFITGTGRLVQGSPYEKQTTDYITKQPLPENKQKYFCGIAFMKNQDGITKFPIIQSLMFQAAQQHPNAAQWAAANWNGFHFKLEDGDDPKNANKPGFPGHWILKFSNGYAPRILDENQMDVSQQPDALYRGCYVRVVGSTKQNGAQGSQGGIYLNFNTIQRVAHGERIITGPDTAAMLAAAPVGQLPPGASQIPTSPQGGLPGAGAPMGGMPGMPGGQPQQPMGGMPGMPGGQPQGQPQQPMGGMPGMPPQGQPQQPMGGMPQGMPGGMPQGQPQQYQQPQQPMGGMPQGMPQGQPQQYQQPQQQYQQPQGMPQGMPQGQPQYQQQQGGMPGGMPGGVPGAGMPYAQ